MTCAFDILRRCGAVAAVLLLGACNTVNYVDRGNVETVGRAQPDADPLARQVDFHLTRAFYETPPDCVMVLPASLPKGTDRKIGAAIDDAVARHLSGYMDRVIGARRLSAQARNRALDPGHPGDRKRLARALRCDSVMEVTTGGVESSYAVVWANVSVGLTLTLRRAKDGQVLWRGAHTAERMDGGLPISVFGAAAGMFNAGRLVGDTDAVPSMIDDNLRRTLTSLPDMRRN